jgi:hypothetical protein
MKGTKSVLAVAATVVSKEIDEEVGLPAPSKNLMYVL